MRVLVIDVVECEPDQLSSLNKATMLHGHAYLHLAMVKFEEPFAMDLAVYDNQSMEVAQLSISLSVTFSVPSLRQSCDESAEESSAYGRVAAGDTYPSQLSEDDGGDWSTLERMAGKPIGRRVRRARAQELSDLSSSFILNEKRALFDASLPLLPQPGDSSSSADDPLAHLGSESAHVVSRTHEQGNPHGTEALGRTDRQSEGARAPQRWDEARMTEPQRACVTGEGLMPSSQPEPMNPPCGSSHWASTRSPVQGLQHRQGRKVGRPSRSHRAKPEGGVGAALSCELLAQTCQILQRATQLRATMVSSAQASSMQATQAAKERLLAARRDSAAMPVGLVREAAGAPFADSRLQASGGMHCLAVPTPAHSRDEDLLEELFFSRPGRPSFGLKVDACQESPCVAPPSASAPSPMDPEYALPPRAAAVEGQSAQATVVTPLPLAGDAPEPTEGTASSGTASSVMRGLQGSLPPGPEPPDAVPSPPMPSRDHGPDAACEERLHIDLEVERARILDENGAPQTLNTYVVCRLCPLLLGDDGNPGTTTRGSCERGQLRTDVCWGSSTPQYRFKHVAPLSTAVSQGPSRGGEQDLILEMWSLADDTQAEDLVGLVRCRVRLAPGLDAQVYATSLLDEGRARPIVNPFDVSTRGELGVRLRVGTPAQLRRSLRLKLAVATIQLHWRRVRNARLARLAGHTVAAKDRAMGGRVARAAPMLTASPGSAVSRKATARVVAEPARQPALAAPSPLDGRSVADSLTAWTFAIRLVRATGIDVWGSLAAHQSDDEEGQLYVHYRVFGQGSVTTAVFGETEAVPVSADARFSCERRVTIYTRLPEDAFLSFVQAERASLEVWWAPSRRELPNIFRHVLVGTSAASLCGAEDGVQVTCGVHPCSASGDTMGELRVAFSLAKGPCEAPCIPLDLPPAAGRLEGGGETAATIGTTLTADAAGGEVAQPDARDDRLENLSDNDISDDEQGERGGVVEASRRPEDANLGPNATLRYPSTVRRRVCITVVEAVRQSSLPNRHPGPTATLCSPAVPEFPLALCSQVLPLSERIRSRSGRQHFVRLLLPSVAVSAGEACDAGVTQWESELLRDQSAAIPAGTVSAGGIVAAAPSELMTVGLSCSVVVDAVAAQAADVQAELQLRRLPDARGGSVESIDGSDLVGRTFISFLRPLLPPGDGTAQPEGAASEAQLQLCPLLRMDGDVPAADGALRIELKQLPEDDSERAEMSLGLGLEVASSEGGGASGLLLGGLGAATRGSAEWGSRRADVLRPAESGQIGAADASMRQLSSCLRDLDEIQASLDARLAQPAADADEPTAQGTIGGDSSRMDPRALALERPTTPALGGAQPLARCPPSRCHGACEGGSAQEGGSLHSSSAPSVCEADGPTGGTAASCATLGDIDSEVDPSVAICRPLRSTSPGGLSPIVAPVMQAIAGLPELVYESKKSDELTTVAPRKLTRIARILQGEGRRALVLSSDDEISSDSN